MLTRALDGYLAVRRAAGFELTVDDGLLHNFVRFATARAETTHVRRQTAIAWATAAPSPSQRERRLGMVRRFVDHARAEDPAHEPVPRHVFAHHRTRPVPYILSATEVQQLLNATARLRPTGSLRPLTFYTLFGLLAATGCRRSPETADYGKLSVMPLSDPEPPAGFRAPPLPVRTADRAGRAQAIRHPSTGGRR